MSFNLVTGRKGEEHVTSTQFRDIIRALYGKETYIPDVNDKLEITQTTATTITVSSGMLIHHGCVFEIPYGDSVTLTIDTPTEGVNKAYKICVDWTVNDGIETGVLEIVPAGSSGLDEGNMQEGDTHDNVVIADVTVTGLTVTVTPNQDIASEMVYSDTRNIVIATESIDQMSEGARIEYMPAAYYIIVGNVTYQTTAVSELLDEPRNQQIGLVHMLAGGTKEYLTCSISRHYNAKSTYSRMNAVAIGYFEAGYYAVAASMDPAAALNDARSDIVAMRIR